MDIFLQKTGNRETVDIGAKGREIMTQYEETKIPFDL